MEMQWVKLNTNMFDNKKLKYIRRLERGNEYALIWVQLLCLAGKCGTSGRLELCEGVPFDNIMLAAEFGFDVDTVTEAMDQFDRLHMIDYNDGTCYIGGWEEHQSIDSIERKRELNRERKRRQRERDKERDAKEDCHVTVTQMSRVTSRDSHATEKSREEKSREEYFSFPESTFLVSSDEPEAAPREKETTVSEIPSQAELQRYIENAGLSVDASEIYDHFAANGWKDKNGNPIEDWRAATRKYARIGNQYGIHSQQESAATPKPEKSRAEKIADIEKELEALSGVEVPRGPIVNTMTREQGRKMRLQARLSDLQRGVAT